MKAQKKSFWIAGIGAVGNILLNLWLIPVWSLYGAAVATVATYVVIFFLYGEAVRRYTPARIFTVSLGKVFVAVGGAAGIMATVLGLAPSVPLPLLILIGGGTYVLCYGAIRQTLLGHPFIA